MITNHISDDIPPQMKILNMVISILMQFCSYKLHNAACHLTKCNLINDVILFRQSQIFEVINSEVTLQNQVHQNVCFITAAAYIQTHFRLLLIMEAHTMNPDQLRRKQSDLESILFVI